MNAAPAARSLHCKPNFIFQTATFIFTSKLQRLFYFMPCYLLIIILLCTIYFCIYCNIIICVMFIARRTSCSFLNFSSSKIKTILYNTVFFNSEPCHMAPTVAKL
jgi:Ni,Fe-hydrogenase I cytochrome b subunit